LFNYAEEFKKLDLARRCQEGPARLMTDSQDWWPADYGHYGPSSSAWPGTAPAPTAPRRPRRRGTGNQRFAPLNSWPDNGNLDKARRLLWPIKQKYGNADLLGRPDDPGRQRRAGVDGLQDLRLRRRPRGHLGARGRHLLGRRRHEWLGDKALFSGDRELENPLAAVQMGLIYVNPEGPNGNPDPVASGRDIRETFARMAMNDEETVALVAGGHTFGKAHGAATRLVGPEPEAAPHRGAWASAGRTATAAARAATPSPAASKAPGPQPDPVGHGLLRRAVRLRVGTDQEPGRRAAVAAQGRASPEDMVPDAHDPSKKCHAPMMTTADLAMRMDPAYEKISRRFHKNPDEFADAFARAWFKLTHRDMGPKVRYLGPEVPAEDLIWQDPVPRSTTR
jgi:catalase-peroxidase